MEQLVDFERRMFATVNGEAMRRIGRQAGFAGKDAAFDAARDKLGADRRMSGMRRKVPLGAGFDQPSPTVVALNFRPAGLWSLADQGRKKGGTIYPRRNNRKTRSGTRGRAVMTPMGPRYSSSYGPSRGTGVFRLAAARARRDVPNAAFRQLQNELRRAIRTGAAASKVVVS